MEQNNTYRLNVALDAGLGDMLQNYVDRTRVTKVSVVTLALREYLEAQAIREALIEQMKDPKQLIEIAEKLGVKPTPVSE